MTRLSMRKAIVSDVNDILQLINELAVYEKAPNEVTNTAQRMIQEGFGERPAFECILAELDNQVVGMALYYYRYSTWKGRRLYLEDLIVTEKQRGKGIGKQLFEQTIQVAKAEECSGMMWQVLDWNQPAIDFYQNYRVRLDAEWVNFHIDF